MNWSADEHYQSEKVANEYDRVRFSSLPGRIFNFLEKRTVRRCFAGVPKGATIADVPCGTGRLAEALLLEGYRVHGLDIAEEMLSVARRRLAGFGANFTCEVADVKALPAAAPSYDAALCARVLMHFPLDEQVQFLANVARLGRSIVVINHSLDSPYQRFRRRVKRLFGDRHDPARCPVSNADIKLLLRRAGLRELYRRRLVPLVSEAIYIVAKKIPSDAQAQPTAADGGTPAAP